MHISTNKKCAQVNINLCNILYTLLLSQGSDSVAVADSNREGYVVLGSSMCYAFLVWGGGQLKRVLHSFCNVSSLGAISHTCW